MYSNILALVVFMNCLLSTLCSAKGAKASWIKSIALGPTIVVLNFQRSQVQTINSPHTQRLQIHITVVVLHHDRPSLRRQLVKDAEGRSVNVTKHMNTTSLAKHRCAKLSTEQVFKRVLFPMEANLLLGGVHANVSELRMKVSCAGLLLIHETRGGDLRDCRNYSCRI